MENQHLSQTEFTGLDLAPVIQQGIRDVQYQYCTPIQSLALPLALKDQDVLGQAQTGTGKTAAFLLATFQRLLSRAPDAQRKPNQPRALIIAPTRELAVQIHKDAVQLGRYCPLRILVVYGGEGYERQRNDVEEGVDILIGTPGRLIDYFKQKVFDLKAIEVVVLDEADRMFDLGFIKDIRFVLRRLPPPEQRLSMMFSATLPLRVTELAYEHMNNPQTVSVETNRITADKVRETLYTPSNDEKIPLLLGILTHMDPSRTMIFVNTKRAGETVLAYLIGNDIHAGMLSGDVPQAKRLRLLQQFQDGELPVLVATDVAARGLHIADVSHVINFDLPQEPEDYVHRIGRTARAGATGDALSFACEEFAYSLLEIEEYIGYPIPRQRIPDNYLLTPKPPAKRERYPQAERNGSPRRKRRPSAGGGRRG